MKIATGFDEYLTAVRALEKDFAARGEWLGRPVPQSDYEFDANAPGLRSLYDVVFLALQTDSTRVATVSITAYYHNVTHHGNLPEKLAQLHAIEAQQFREYARLSRQVEADRRPDQWRQAAGPHGRVVRGRHE